MHEQGCQIQLGTVDFQQLPCRISQLSLRYNNEKTRDEPVVYVLMRVSVSGVTGLFVLPIRYTSDGESCCLIR